MQPAILVCIIGLFTISPCLHADPATLYSENFDKAESASAEYPPPDGVHKKVAGGRISGWAGAGIVRLSTLPQAGVNATGGLLVTPVEGSDNTVYYLATIEPITFAGRTGSNVSPEDIRALRLSFAIRIPSGLKINCSINLLGPEELKNELWASRLQLPQIVGTRSFFPVAIQGDQFSAEAIQTFIATARKIGDRRLRLSVQWHVADAATWPPGESFALDDIDLNLLR